MSGFGPSLGQPGYLPYCGRCPTMLRMRRGERAFECVLCGLQTRNINGEDMFDRTAPTITSPIDDRIEGEER